MRIEIPASWCGTRSQVDVTLPRMFVCARCGGGGCDGCDRSGAIRTPDERVGQKLRVPLPESLGGGVEVRLPSPFGDEGALDQLLIEIRIGEAASEGVLRVMGRRAGRGWRHATRGEKVGIAAIGIVPVLAVLAALFGR